MSLISRKVDDELEQISRDDSVLHIWQPYMYKYYLRADLFMQWSGLQDGSKSKFTYEKSKHLIEERIFIITWNYMVYFPISSMYQRNITC